MVRLQIAYNNYFTKLKMDKNKYRCLICFLPILMHKQRSRLHNINPLKPSGKYICHRLLQSITLHFVYMDWQAS
jgi:hypothetical protein